MGKASRSKREARAARPGRDIRTTVERLEAAVSELDQLVPGWSGVLDGLRARRGVDLPEWPEWCLLPMAGAYAVAEAAGLLDLARGDTAAVGAMAGLYAWRQGRSVYRFDPELADAVVDTDLDVEIPVEVLYRLPEWAVYIDRPSLGREMAERWPSVVSGACAYLEWDTPRARAELHLLLDLGPAVVAGIEGWTGMFDIPLHLEAGTVSEMLALADQAATAEASRLGVALPGLPAGGLGAMADVVRPIVALVLYLCSEAADIRDPDQPNAAPRRRRAAVTGPAKQWDVGYRIGTALRHARATRDEGDAGGRTGRPVAAHIRRAHFHVFHSGKGSRSDPTLRETNLRWLAPTVVGAGELTPVVKTVRRPST